MAGKVQDQWEAGSQNDEEENVGNREPKDVQARTKSTVGSIEQVDTHSDCCNCPHKQQQQIKLIER